MRVLCILLIASVMTCFGCGAISSKILPGGGVQGSGNVRSEARKVSGFSKIKASNAIVLNVTVGKDFSVVVEADDNLLGHVTTDVSGDSLVIETRDSISTRSDIKATVSLPTLDGLDLSGASNATVSGVTGESLKVVASGASRLKIDGSVKELVATASGASNINAESLAAVNADAEVSGASTVAINASGKADLSASGASTITYLGQPTELQQDSSGASSIRAR